MKAIILFSLAVSFSAHAQNWQNPLAMAAGQYFQTAQRARACQFLVESIFTDQRPYSTNKIINDLSSRDQLNLSPGKRVSIGYWINEQRAEREGKTSEQAMENCMAISSAWFANDSEGVIHAAVEKANSEMVAAAMLPKETENSFPHEAEHLVNISCENPSEVVCEIELPPIPTEWGELGEALRIRYSLPVLSIADLEDPCSCLGQKIKNQIPNPLERARQIEQSKEKLAKTIIQNAGQRFMDSLASNYEDVNFYKTLPDKSSRYSALYCANAQDMAARLGEGCNVPESIKQERLGLIFNSLGAVSESNTVEGLLSDFTNKVRNLEQDTGSSPYTRDQFDVRRFSLSNTNETFKAADRSMAKMLSTPSIRNRIQAELNNTAGAPDQAILKIIIEDIRNSNSLPSYIDISNIDEEKRNLIMQSLAAGKLQEVGLELYSQISYAMTIHPGLARILSNRNTYNRVSDRFPEGMTSLKEFAEGQDELMASDFSDECERLKEDLSQLVCSSNDDIIKSVPRRDLAAIVNENSDGPTVRDMNNHLLCQAPQAESRRAFTGIAPDDFYSPAINSDFKARVGGNQHASAFDLLYHAEQANDNIKDEINVAVMRTEISHRGWADHIANRFHGDRGGRISERTIAETLRSSEERRLQSIPSSRTQNVASNYSSLPEEEPSAPVPVSNQPAPATTAFIPPSSAYSQVSSQKTEQAMNGFSKRDYFEQRYAQDEINELRKNVSPQQLSELERLREQARINRQTLEELTSQNQQAKIRALQDDIRELESRKNLLENRTVDSRRDDSENATSRSNSLSSLNRSIASAVTSPEMNGTNSRGTFSGGASVSGSEGGGSSKASAAAVAAPPAPVPSRQSTGSLGALVITSATPRNGDLAPSELSQEIIRYLDRTNPDLKVLTQIKENGMLYKFRTVENGIEKEKEVLINFDNLTEEAKRALDERIARKSSEISTVAALNNQITAARRSYSYEALKFIIGQEVQREIR